ncbi:MAG: TerB family tellurite resistance protein [Candidatus Hydrogenedentota bacterium]
MLKRFLDILTKPPAPAPREDRMNSVPIAVCVVLLEAAMADNEFTEEEHGYITEVMQRRFALSADEAQELVSTAAVVRDDSRDLWQFTHAINENFSPAEKVALLEDVWRIIYSDGTLAGHEDYLAHKLRKLFNLNHKLFINAKLKVLDEIRTAE